MQDGISPHAVPYQIDIVRVCVVLSDKLRPAHIVCQDDRILHAVGNQVFPLAAPSAPVVRRQHHAANAAQSVGQIVIAGRAGKAVEQNHTGPRPGAVWPEDLPRTGDSHG